MRIDHVAFAVGDLEEAAGRFRREYGLDSTPGGRHPGWGTANRIVPLGEAYLELVAAVDEGAASRSVFGRAVLERAAAGGGWAAICVAPDDLDSVASRLGLEVVEGRRERPDGSRVRWRSAGVEDERRAPWMPFFIAWDIETTEHPGRLRAGHGSRVEGIARVEVGGDAAALRDWLGGASLPLVVVPGPPGIRAVALATAGDELVIA
ncbi:MAG: VOC family protein [Actinomycetota bacterium]